MTSQSPRTCQACIFTRRQDRFLLNESGELYLRWPGTQAQPGHRWQPPPAILLTREKNWGAWIFWHLLLILDPNHLAVTLPQSSSNKASWYYRATIPSPQKPEHKSPAYNCCHSHTSQNIPSSDNMPQIQRASLPPTLWPVQVMLFVNWAPSYILIWSLVWGETVT